LKSHVDSAIAADKVGLVALLSSGLEDSEGTWSKLEWLVRKLMSRGIVLMYPTESVAQYTTQRMVVGLTLAQRFSAGVNAWVRLADSTQSDRGMGAGYLVVVRYSIQQLCWYLGVFK
jgi:hypothetical protein